MSIVAKLIKTLITSLLIATIALFSPLFLSSAQASDNYQLSDDYETITGPLGTFLFDELGNSLTVNNDIGGMKGPNVASGGLSANAYYRYEYWEKRLSFDVMHVYYIEFQSSNLPSAMNLTTNASARIYHYTFSSIGGWSDQAIQTITLLAPKNDVKKSCYNSGDTFSWDLALNPSDIQITSDNGEVFKMKEGLREATTAETNAEIKDNMNARQNGKPILFVTRDWSFNSAKGDTIDIQSPWSAGTDQTSYNFKNASLLCNSNGSTNVIPIRESDNLKAVLNAYYKLDRANQAEQDSLGRLNESRQNECATRGYSDICDCIYKEGAPKSESEWKERATECKNNAAKDNKKPGCDGVETLFGCFSGKNAITDYTNKVFNWGLFAGFLLTILITTFGGFLYMTSGGNPDSISNAKSWILGAITSMAVLLLAKVIFNTVGLNWFGG
ncbi:MAG: hypothetical protein UU65_C0002G0187 [candidate division CPR2 bacterium GW2011_GWC1_41_48]|uniref:Uncharacterized protein n=1 Tax=candidate division CPR2 bacterium GW2011_GWC1_41_48 TaxID=1618344 RepID=A0A0G0W8S9_UNCC2|nr:MAG: hypothetical protein UT47_C0002G0117 [candidate division CPR2 bacterium GW2011_GWC2_39_35]KKR27698.1 MAG: hypothetical protein UT60_C0040G0020 [candidate division CPR2 bacterium GW2011_GWD2_39_7]KKS09409.1 MAG: hypothetical protein UU65_C0002G0187 [candidate division CPR2 bacterium GW2011_GWC1_41_48]OGB71771.1 MAG: hypothetical protein A2Y26_05475 [candidate division CPR2 bacterium GWD2_39_7]